MSPKLLSPVPKGPIWRIGRRALPVSHLDKVYWPKDGITKGDLLAYYRDVAPLMVPHLKGRPLSLNRHPDGIEGESFFQKNVSEMKHPSWARTAKIRSESLRKTVEYLVCDEPATLVYMANLGCIEIDPWLSRVGSLEDPDFAVIDLDPEDAPFEHAVSAAQVVRRILEDANVPSYPKTSGGRGLHIYVPLAARYSYDEARGFAELIARLAADRIGEGASLVRDPRKRRGKIYFDVPQNREGATTVAPYSVRPRPGAPVSAPLEWKDVRRGLDPARYTLRTMPKRLDRVGDLFRPALGRGIDMAKALDALRGRAG